MSSSSIHKKNVSSSSLAKLILPNIGFAWTFKSYRGFVEKMRPLIQMGISIEAHWIQLELGVDIRDNAELIGDSHWSSLESFEIGI